MTRFAQAAKSLLLLEFVSANPTGPLHVGHGRHAAYGATVGYDATDKKAVVAGTGDFDIGSAYAVYVAGELGGMGLIKNSVEQGMYAVENIVKTKEINPKSRRRASCFKTYEIQCFDFGFFNFINNSSSHCIMYKSPVSIL